MSRKTPIHLPEGSFRFIRCICSIDREITDEELGTPADETRREAPAAGIQSMNMPTDYHALLEMIEAIVREIDIADVPPHTYYSIPEEDRYP